MKFIDEFDDEEISDCKELNAIDKIEFENVSFLYNNNEILQN